MQMAAALGIGLQAQNADIAPLSLSVIERLLQVFQDERGESLCKTLLALRLHPVEEGSSFTVRQAQVASLEVIGMDTLRSALTAVLPSGKGIFCGCDKVSVITHHISSNTCSQSQKITLSGDWQDSTSCQPRLTLRAGLRSITGESSRLDWRN